MVDETGFLCDFSKKARLYDFVWAVCIKTSIFAMMMHDDKYQEIRPCHNDEFAEAVEELLTTPQVITSLQLFFPETNLESIKARIRKISTIEEFQKLIIYDILVKILNTTTNGFSFSGIERLDKAEAYLYISNHRDITLDPSLISFALVESGLETPEIAIGDNLLTEKWITTLVRINKSFIVKRNLPPRELVVASRLLSGYIHHAVVNRKHSVWIAQREGRAKDGNDVTQLGLLGMLDMVAENGIVDHFLKLNPVPVSISYEYDPTDYEKVRRLYAERFLGGYKKEQKEDENSMKKGIFGNKGRVHIHFGEPLKPNIRKIQPDARKAEVENQIRALLDYQIIKGYKLWPVNYIANDLFRNADVASDLYTKEQKQAFVEEVESKVAKMEGDPALLKEIFYEIYARPAINKEKIEAEAGVFNGFK